MARKIPIPHTYVIVFAFIAAAVVLTWILPGGEFDRELVDVNGTMREVIVEGSFHDAEKHPQTWQLFSAMFDGFANIVKNVSITIILQALVFSLWHYNGFPGGIIGVILVFI